MSSLYEFSSFYEFIGLPIIEGVIVGLDPSNDTAKVKIQNSDGRSFEEFSNVPIFFHCRRDASHRDNGAIEGASSAFSIGDKVLILCKIDPPSSFQSISCVAVIGHAGPRRDCGIIFSVFGGIATGSLAFGSASPFVMPYRFAIDGNRPSDERLVLLYDAKKYKEELKTYRVDYPNMPEHFYYFPQLRHWYYNMYEVFDQTGQGTGVYVHPSQYGGRLYIPLLSNLSADVGDRPCLTFTESYEIGFWAPVLVSIGNVSYTTMVKSTLSLVDVEVNNAPQIGGYIIKRIYKKKSDEADKKSTITDQNTVSVLSARNELVTTFQMMLSNNYTFGIFDLRQFLGVSEFRSQTERFIDEVETDLSGSSPKTTYKYQVDSYSNISNQVPSLMVDSFSPHPKQSGVMHICPSDKGLNLIRAESFYGQSYGIYGGQVLEHNAPEYSIPNRRRLRYGRYMLTTITPDKVETVALDDPRYSSEGLMAALSPRYFPYRPWESEGAHIQSKVVDPINRTGFTVFNSINLPVSGPYENTPVYGWSYRKLNDAVTNYYQSRGIVRYPTTWSRPGEPPESEFYYGNDYGPITVSTSFNDIPSLRYRLLRISAMCPPKTKDYFSAVDSSKTSWVEQNFGENFTKYAASINLNNTQIYTDGEKSVISILKTSSSHTINVPSGTAVFKCFGNSMVFPCWDFSDDHPSYPVPHSMIKILPYKYRVMKSQTFSKCGWVLFSKLEYISHTITNLPNCVWMSYYNAVCETPNGKISFSSPGSSYFYELWHPVVLVKIRTKQTFHIGFYDGEQSCTMTVPDEVCSLLYDDCYICLDTDVYPLRTNQLVDPIRAFVVPESQGYGYTDLISCNGFLCMFTGTVTDQNGFVFKYDVFKYQPWTHNVNIAPVVIQGISPSARNRIEFRLQGQPPLPTDLMDTDSRYLGAIGRNKEKTLTTLFHEKTYSKDGEGVYKVYYQDGKMEVPDSNNVWKAKRVNNILPL